MLAEPTNVRKCLNVDYKHCVAPSCFGHSYNNNNNYYYYLLQMGCHPVAVITRIS
jgi:hypothetical protein